MLHKFDDYIEIPLIVCATPIVVLGAIVVGTAWAICKLLEIFLTRFI